MTPTTRCLPAVHRYTDLARSVQRVPQRCRTRNNAYCVNCAARARRTSASSSPPYYATRSTQRPAVSAASTMVRMPQFDRADAANPTKSRIRLFAFVAFFLLVDGIVGELTMDHGDDAAATADPQESHIPSKWVPWRNPGASVYTRKRLSVSHTLALTRYIGAITSFISDTEEHLAFFKTGVLPPSRLRHARGTRPAHQRDPAGRTRVRPPPPLKPDSYAPLTLPLPNSTQSQEPPHHLPRPRMPPQAQRGPGRKPGVSLYTRTRLSRTPRTPQPPRPSRAARRCSPSSRPRTRRRAGTNSDTRNSAIYFAWVGVGTWRLGVG